MSIRSFAIASAIAAPAGAKPGTVNGPAIDLMDSDTFPTDVEIVVYNQTVTATDASPGVFTWDGFPGTNDDVVVIESGAPEGFIDGESYFVVNATTNTFDLSATVGGSPITTTSTGTAVEIELHHNIGGTGVSAAPGAPFLPGYSAVLFLAVSDDTDLTFNVQGTNALADGTPDEAGWTTLATVSANGHSMTQLSGQSVDGAANPLYQFLRYQFVGSATAAAGTGNAFLLGDG